MSDPIKVLIVDDSDLIRHGIASIFDHDGQVEVVGQAANGKEALSMIDELDPDIVTLDVNMPVMDGLTTLKHLMVTNPRPVIMLSSLTSEGANTTFDALRYGAVDFIAKPSRTDEEFNLTIDLLLHKVKAAAEIKVDAVRYIRIPDNNNALAGNSQKCQQVVVIGAAEGGYGSLLKIVPQLSNNNAVAFLVVLYAEQKYTQAFAQYLDSISAIKVKAACHDDPLEAGVCYISSGNDYLTVHHEDDRQFLHVRTAPFEFRKGSVDRALFSVSEIFGTNAAGVILSGNGTDGIEGLDEVLHNGGTGIVQDPANCMFKEMAMTAVDQCQPDYVVNDTQIPAVISDVFYHKQGAVDSTPSVRMGSLR